jgi:hypothetical protein
MEERKVKMNQIEVNKQRAQLLVTARNLLNDEYQKKRSEQFAKWQTESNHLWVSKGIILPYPSSFGYPSEEEIVAKALELYNAQNNIKPAGVELPTTDESMTSSVTAKLIEVSQNVKPVALPEVPEQTPWEQYLLPEEIKQPEPETEVKLPEPTASIPVIPLPEPVVEPEPVIEDVAPKEEPELTEEQLEEVKSNSRLRGLLAQFITMAKNLDAKAKKDEGTPI